MRYLKTLAEPKMLLLGSLGSYSAKNFAEFLHKINNTAIPNVIDVWEESVAVIATDTQRDAVHLTQGDAQAMPYARGTFEQVYTNFLFHALEPSHKENHVFEKRIKKVLSEANRVLKPGGSLLLHEQAYGEYQRPGSEGVRSAVEQLIQDAGFSIIKSLPGGYCYVLTNERMSATLDTDGVAHYEDTLIEIERKDLAYRCVKTS